MSGFIGCLNGGAQHTYRGTSPERRVAANEKCPVCTGQMQRRDGMGTPWKCAACGFRVHQGYLDKLHHAQAAAKAEAVRPYADKLREWQGKAANLVATLNAYDGRGIPIGDAGDAFALLREMRDTGPDQYGGSCGGEVVKRDARALLDQKET